MSSSDLVEPAFKTGPAFDRTLGPEVADLGELAGFIADPEQRLGLDILFGMKASNDISAAFEFAVICARQNLKTGLLKLAGLGWLFITEERLIVWSAHEFSTAREAHRDMVELIDGCAWLSRRVKAVYDSSNDKSIHLKSGARLIFKARTQSGGRGLSGNKVILDEALYLRAGHMASLVPTLSVQPDPQLIYASSAGRADSDVLRGVRDRGRRDGVSPRLAYLEWCAQVGGCAQDHCDHALGVAGCALDKVENLQAANPLLGRRRANGTGLTLEYLRSERETFAAMPMEFARERLGWWDDPGAAEVFGAGKWQECGGPTPDGVRLAAVAVAVSVGLDHAAVVGVGSAGARTYVQVLAHGPGYDWVADHCPRGVPVVLDPKGPASVVVPLLKKARRQRKEMAIAQVLDAFDDFFTLVVDGLLLHDNDPVLTRAANNAVPRDVGDRRMWGRRKSTADISPIEAATLAASWVLRTPEPAPAPAPPRSAPAATPKNDLMTVGF